MVNFITPAKGRITSPFGMRLHPISLTKLMHWGVDYGNTPLMNEIIASAEGTVERASVFGGYGNTIIITHNIDGVLYQTLYAHLHSMSVKVGQKVKQGQTIGIKGTTGNSTGVHLHFEIHVGGKRNSNYTYAKDPLLYMDVESANKTVVGSVTNVKEPKNGMHDGKLYWDGLLFKKGQIGKITILKNINLWTDDKNGKLKMVRVLKKGEEYRVYGYREGHGGQYGLGAEMWVTKMNGYIRYQTPSKNLLKLAENLK